MKRSTQTVFVALMISHSLFFSNALFAADGNVECPADTTSDSLEDFRDAVVAKIGANNYGEAVRAIKKCFPNERPACYQDLISYVDEKGPNGGQYDDGGVFSDLRTDNPSLSSEKDLPPEFLQKNALGETVKGQLRIPTNIFEIAKSKGWKAISYKTRSTGGFDSPPNLTLVVLPGKDKDVYLQISPNPDAHRELTDHLVHPQPSQGTAADGQNTLTVITVDKTKSPPIGQLRLISKDQQTGNYVWNNNLQSQRCLECHTTPLRSISPRGYRVTNGPNEDRMNPDDEKTVSEINQMMLVDGLSWGRGLDTRTGKDQKRGPPVDSQPYGWAPSGSKTRQDPFLTACAQDDKKIGYTGFGGYKFTAEKTPNHKVDTHKIGTAMNCTQCHDGGIRGYLHSKFSPSEIKFKILVDRSMPPGQNLDTDERMALYNCIMAEKTAIAESGAWTKSGAWMKKAACEDFEPEAATRPATRNLRTTK